MKRTAPYLTVLLAAVLSAGCGKTKNPVMDIRLPMPQKKSECGYLGVEPTFSLSAIEAEAVVIEVLSRQCFHCQREAPRVNEFYDLLQESGYADKFKMIGIGANNNDLDVKTFRFKYGIRFPVFPDPHGEISRQLGVTETPSFLALRIMDDGQDVVCRSLTGIDDAEKFLHEVIRKCNLEDGKCTWE